MYNCSCTARLLQFSQSKKIRKRTRNFKFVGFYSVTLLCSETVTTQQNKHVRTSKNRQNKS